MNNSGDFNDKKNFKKNARKKEQKKPMIFMIVVVFIFALIALMILCISVFRPKVDDRPHFFDDTSSGEITSTTGTGDIPSVNPGIDDYKRKEGYYTFLVCGTDKVSRSTDVMMLISLDTKSGNLNILQIPRDTFINPDIVGYNVTRVNAIYSQAYNATFGAENEKDREKKAMEVLCGKLQSALCITIDRYVLMDTEAFVNIIDAIGGVDYYVPMDMYWNDPEQGLLIDLKEGQQILDGKKAEQFIRFRDGYATGDIGRVEARSDFLKAAYTQVRSNLTLPVIIEIAKQVINYVTTDMSIEDTIFFASAVYGMKSDNINIKTIAGSAVMNPLTGKWSPYYALNKRMALEDINSYMNAFGKDIEESLFDKKALFSDDPNGNNPYISEYYYS